jgi:hypothetical protein
MVANPEEKNRWRALPTPEEWSEVTRLARELISLGDPARTRRKLELLALARPRLAARLAAIVGLSLAL